MNTYVAQVETISGKQQLQIAAANIQDAQAQLEVLAQRAPEGVIRYTIQGAQPAASPEAIGGLVDASMGLFACLILFVITEYKLRRYFKG